MKSPKMVSERIEAPAADVLPAYLEDASGLKGGHAERVFVPADDAAVADILRQASAAGIAVTVPGSQTQSHRGVE